MTSAFSDSPADPAAVCQAGLIFVVAGVLTLTAS
jgi:hypothetical protein